MEGDFNGFWLHFGDHLGGKNLQKSMPKLDEKLDAISEAILRIQGAAKRSARSGWGLEFGKNLATSGKILSTLLPAGPGAADSIASRIPPGLGLASGVLAVWCLLGLVGLVALFFCWMDWLVWLDWFVWLSSFFWKIDVLKSIF